MSGNNRAAPPWALELAALTPLLTAYVARRGLSWLLDDALGTVGLELARLDRRGELSSEIEAIKGLIWRIFKFRIRDGLRGQFVKSALSNEEEGNSIVAKQPSVTFDEAAQIDARRLLLAVADCIAELPDDDRLLVTRDLDEAAEEKALSGRDRVRLLRLRRMLADLAIARVKEEGRALANHSL